MVNLKNGCVDVYPNEMELEKEIEDSYKVSFLDLSKEVHDRKVTTKLLDERDTFLFYINCLPNIVNKKPYTIYYTSIGCEILAIAMTTSHLFIMVTRDNLLLILMKTQGSEYTSIISLMKKRLRNTLKELINFETLPLNA